MKFRILLAFLSISYLSYSQSDTVRVAQYNLLYYGVNIFSCSNSAAVMLAKDANLKKIMKEIKPDILCVNELGSNAVLADRILQNVLNTDGVNYYQRGEFTATPGASIANMMFYNSEKLGLITEEIINSPVRIMNLSKLYYKDSLLSQFPDTAFITVINGHLKAGSSSSDKSERAAMTSEVINVLSNKGKRDNYLVMGDFNSQSSSEQGIQNLLNPTNPLVKFIDPINSLGSWNNNSNFANIHTQSTHVVGSCPSGGGMDDRFDVIFASEYIMGDSAKVSYIPGSYAAFGQDGNHFNQDINAGTNSAVADSIADALYDMSDHLPVLLDVKIALIEDTTTIALAAESKTLSLRLVQNPVEHSLKLELKEDRSYLIKIYGAQSKLVSESLLCSHKSYELPFETESGFYILNWVDSQGERGSIKILKN